MLHITQQGTIRVLVDAIAYINERGITLFDFFVLNKREFMGLHSFFLISD
jgi:hypothetical protein